MSESPSTNLFTRIYNKAAGTTSTKPTAKQLEDRDTKSIEAQSKMPMWKQYAIKAFDNSIDAGMGMLGIGKETKANLAGQLVQAGLPFFGYAGKGIRQLYHGTPDSLWTKFNPDVYNKQDVLGHMTHAAEDAAYADKYATKSAWPISNRNGQRIIPLQPEAKNVLDLVDPNADDISQALAFASPAERNNLIRKFKTANRQIGEAPEWVRADFRHKYNANAPTQEYPLRKVAEDLQLSPEVTENMPWDAIRYLDEDNKSWAFPKRTPIRTTYGVPMNDAAEMGVSPIKLVRDDNVTTGNFPIISKATQSSKNKPKSSWSQFTDTLPDGYADSLDDDEINSLYLKWAKNKSNAKKLGLTPEKIDEFTKKSESQLESLKADGMLSYEDYQSILYKKVELGMLSKPIYKNTYNVPELTNPNHGIQTPYIVVDPTGKVVSGSGSKKSLTADYPEHFVIPNKDYKKGNGDGGSLKTFTQDEYDFMNKQFNTLKPK